MSTSTPDSSVTLDRQMGFAILRFVLGINMLGRSLMRLPEISEFASGMAEGFADTFLPAPFVYAFGFVIVLTELVIGVLLVLGWKKRWALLTMGILLASLTFGQLVQQSYGSVANILIYVIAVAFLLFNTRYDNFGIDRGFSVKRKV